VLTYTLDNNDAARLPSAREANASGLGIAVIVAVLATFFPVMVAGSEICSATGHVLGCGPVTAGMALAIPAVLLVALISLSRAFRFFYLAALTVGWSIAAFAQIEQSAGLLHAIGAGVAVLAIGSALSYGAARLD
jgi:hypothetical protein